LAETLKGKRPSYPVELVPETRTSSPVRIAPDPTSRMHSRHPGLFPCGKSATYAGGTCRVEVASAVSVAAPLAL